MEAGSGGPRVIADDADLDAAIARLRDRDPAVVGRLLAVGGRPPLRRSEPTLERLASIVVSQQVSTASAAAIFGRLGLVLRREEPERFDAQDLLAAEDGALRSAGLSQGKIATLRAVAAAVAEGRLLLDRLGALPHEEASAGLRRIRGIGPWTAEVFLLVCVGAADAWPAGDVALQEAARIALSLPARPDAAALTALAERWRPDRAAAARLLWSYYRVAKGREGIGRLAD